MQKRHEKGFGAIVFIAIAVVVIAIGLAAWFVVTHNNKSDSSDTNTNSTITPTPTPTITTSEQPNLTKFKEFLSSFNLAKMAIGATISPPDSMPSNTNTFTASDQFCTNMNIKKTIPVGSYSYMIYNVSTKQNDLTKTVSPNELKQGGSSGCSTLEVSAGKYEYKAYIDDVLIVDQLFEVK
jgi:hypothetical protein